MNLIEKVRELARKHPDRVAACEYAVAGVPECIIGHALAAEGWSGATLEKEGNRSALGLWTGGLLPGVSEAGAHWLQRVQAAQDAGLTWADAVELADKERDNAG